MAAIGPLDGQAGLGQVGVGQDLAGAEHGLARDACRPEPLDPDVTRLGREERHPARGPLAELSCHLVAVVAVRARLVAEDLDQRAVHALAAEPHLDQPAVGAAVQEVRERRALLPVPLDLGCGALRPADHAAEGGEHPVIERGLGPAAGPRLGAAAQEREHRGGQQRGRAEAGRPDVDEDRAGPVAGELGAEPGPGLHQEAEILDAPLGRPARAAPGVDERRVRRPQVAVAQAPAFNQCFRPVHQRDVRVAEQREHLARVVGGDEALVAVPGPPPAHARVDGHRRRARHPHDAGAEVGEEHARHSPGQPETEVTGADRDLDDRKARARQSGGRSVHGVTLPEPERTGVAALPPRPA